MTLTRPQRLTGSIGILLGATALYVWGLAKLPPGLTSDEAFFLLRAQDILRGQTFPVYLMGNGGIEPLYFYLTAVGLAVVGPVTWAGRLMAAWSGVVGVALTIRTGEEMFPRRGMGILAGLFLATLYWYLNFSRYGVQYGFVTTFAVGALAAFWYSLRTGQRRAYVAAGICMGLGLNTYVAFRLFLLVPLSVGLMLFITRRKQRPTLLLAGLWAGSAMLLLYGPVGLFFIQNPNWFFLRFNQTTSLTLAAPSWQMTLISNLLKVLGSFFIQGDADWRHNLATRPALDASQALFFALGLIISFRHWRKPETWTLLAWLGIGLLPSILTERAPHFGRTTMVTPAIALLLAVGVTTLWEHAPHPVTRSLIAVAMALSVAITVRDYFGRWAGDRHLFDYFEIKDAWLAEAFTPTQPSAALYATPLHLNYYHTNFWPLEYRLGSEVYQQVRTFNGRECVVLPSLTTTPTAYAVIVAEDERTLPNLKAAFPAGTQRTVAWRDEVAYLDLYQIPVGQAPRIAMSTERWADFSGLVQLLGYTLDPTPPLAGGQIKLTITWQVERPSQNPYKSFVHLIGTPKPEGSIVYAQHDQEPCANTYPTWQWRTGELVMETYTLALPDDVPAGAYFLQTGWYEDAGERLAAFDLAGQALGDAVRLETIQVSLP